MKIKPYFIAKIKGVTNQTVYRWIREGVIPKEKVSKVTVERFEIEDSVLREELADYPKKK